MFLTCFTAKLRTFLSGVGTLFPSYPLVNSLFGNVDINMFIIVLFAIADHYMIDTFWITWPFMFHYATPSIIQMDHFMLLLNVRHT